VVAELHFEDSGSCRSPTAWTATRGVHLGIQMGWMRDRMTRPQEVLERWTTRAALLLRSFLGPIGLKPVPVEVERPSYHGLTGIDTLALIEPPPGPGSPDSGPTSLRSGGCRTRTDDLRRAKAALFQLS
jgi:hypothetical protein